MKKIISIVGARPQFIKHAPLQLELQKFFNALTIHTGQHYDKNMSDIFFSELKIPQPDYHFNLTGVTHGLQTAQMIQQIEEVAIKEMPDAILVYGDTNSTLAGALVASKLQIILIHIEAGLRSYNKSMPEEINRILTDHVSNFLFCPSVGAIENLKRENIVKNVFKCGDVMRDTLILANPYLTSKELYGQFYFATIHRPYNTDSISRITSILNVMQNLDKQVVFALHPRTNNLLNKYGISLAEFDNIVIVEPQSYFESLSFQTHSIGIITDSGGVQKEAYWLKKKCITIRPETEWTETLEGGWNNLCFDNLHELPKLLTMEPKEYNDKLYGSGNAAMEIVNIIREHVK